MATTAALFKTGAWRRVIGSPTSFFAASKTRQFSTSTAAQKKVDNYMMYLEYLEYLLIDIVH
jgi:hypothetical protein